MRRYGAAIVTEDPASRNPLNCRLDFRLDNGPLLLPHLPFRNHSFAAHVAWWGAIVKPSGELLRSCRARALRRTSEARQHDAGHSHGLCEFQAGALGKSSELLLRKSVRITRKLGDRKQASGSQRIRDRYQTRLGLGDFAEYRHEESNVKSARTKRECDGIRLSVAGVSVAGAA